MCVPGFQKFVEITGEKTQTYIRGKRLIAMQDEDGAWSIFGNNYRGDVERVQRGSYSNGRYNNRYAYDAFGNYSEETDSPKKNPFRYSGEYTDDETGLIYLRNRYYDPAIGRFITEDPAKDGLNWYAYCSNNPVNLIDPLGLFDYNDRLGPSKKYSTDVKVMQNELAWLGYYSGDIDGYFGQKTLDAVNAYKNAMGLGNTGADWGIVGKQTWESMGLIFRTQADTSAGVEIVTIGLKQYKDVTSPINYALSCSAAIFSNHNHDFLWFYEQVKTGATWDIKLPNRWKETIKSTYPGSESTEVIYMQKIMTPESLGNMTYGYLGSAAGFSRGVLFYGGDFAANDGKLNPKGLLKGAAGVLQRKDSLYDKANIAYGCELYELNGWRWR